MQLNLALQGGGAHGAFTWGVLDRLLAEPGLSIDGISGTSAGAMNAAVLADGYERGGADGARAALEAFWRTMSRQGAFSPWRSVWGTPFAARWSPFGMLADWTARLVSPYQLNPLDINPLRKTLERTIDFERLRCCRAMQLFISATNVRTGRLKVFTTAELSAEVLLASACLPQLYQAVEVDGDHYWDGGFLGNPTLEPLLLHCACRDILIVQVNPRYRAEIPTTAETISDRVNEITFNASLMREIRNIANLRLLDDVDAPADAYDCARLHLVDGDDVLAGFGARSKRDTGWLFLSRLCDLGRERAESWLQHNASAIGQRSTLNVADWAPGYT